MVNMVSNDQNSDMLSQMSNPLAKATSIAQMNASQNSLQLSSIANTKITRIDHSSIVSQGVLKSGTSSNEKI